MSLKNSTDIIRNGTRDLPACSAVPQICAVMMELADLFTYQTAWCHIPGRAYVVCSESRFALTKGVPQLKEP
jgi:hypothetical protein